MNPNIDLDLELSSKYRTKAGEAKQRGITWGLTFAQYKKIVTTKKCAYTGQPMVRGEGHSNPDNLSIDRIDSSKGYVKGNVVACTVHANKVKAAIEMLQGKRSNVDVDVYKDAVKILSKAIEIMEEQ